MPNDSAILDEDTAAVGGSAAIAAGTSWQPPQIVRAGLARVELQLRHVTKEAEYPWIGDLSSYLNQAGGKRLRPVLTLLWGHPANGREQPLTDAATAVELLHLATLYHDDLIDCANTRRGRPSVQAIWGHRRAAIAGTLVFAKSLRVLARLGHDANAFASRAATAIWQGQLQECELTFNTDVTLEEYFSSIRGKAGALFALACELGALGRGADGETLALAGIYGSKIGTAFQVVDDLLDLVADPGTLDKPCATDLRKGVYTLPTILCLRQGSAAAARLRRLLDDEDLSPDVADEARRTILASGCLESVPDIVSGLADDAADLLQNRAGAACDALRELAAWTAERGVAASALD